MEIAAKRRGTTSLYIGVSQDRATGTWTAQVSAKGKRHRVAGFIWEREAARARDRMARHFFGDLAPLNFPDERVRPASPQQLKRARSPEPDQRTSRPRQRASKRRTRAGTLVPDSVVRADQRQRRTVPARHERYPRSRYTGVFHLRHPTLRCPWQAKILALGRREYLGNWDTERAAALAVDRARIHYKTAMSNLNFPELAHRLRPADAATLRAEAHRLVKTGTTSRFPGVSRTAGRATWSARISDRGNTVFLGNFSDELSAARAYERAATRLRGKRAKPKR